MILLAKIIIRGAVQGVGFRPFIYRLAAELKLTGFVNNSPLGVFIEAEGAKSQLDEFILRIEKEKPPISVITSLEFSFLDPKGYNKFEIVKSDSTGLKTTLILPDIAVCSDCLNEMFDPNDRRFRYPFINCTNCGPRFSIIESIPYDRPNTSMKKFTMCEDCRKEYKNPLDRRFHAQPIACPKCGPNVELWNESGKIISKDEDGISETASQIRNGKIIALKGLGGFHLIVDARNGDAVNRLRQKKFREEKPFALMFLDLESVKKHCAVSPFEERVMCSPESPIVLLKKMWSAEWFDGAHHKCGMGNNDSSLPSAIHTSHAAPYTPQSTLNISHFTLSDYVAPDNPYLGIMLPYTPLHHLLMHELNFPIVATSGNLSEEPMCIDEYEALNRLNGIADYFLVHDRPIVRHTDDSIVRIIDGREMVMRRARGYAPLPIQIKNSDESEDILAVGGHLKNTVALKVGTNVFISQHIGDLSTNESYNTFQKVIHDFQNLYESKVSRLVCDLHPEYISTKFAQEQNLKIEQVQHHLAHIASCRAENQIEGKALGVSWDGTGFGFDKTIWGGEFFLTDDDSYKHIGQFRKFRLPGGEAAIKEPRRSALGLLYEIYKEKIFSGSNDFLSSSFTEVELNLLKEMLKKKVNCPQTSSAGRLFDAVSSLLWIVQHSNYEGQAAMMLEFAADRRVVESYPIELKQNEIFIFDWKNLVEAILYDLKKHVKTEIISAKFHNSLAELIVQLAKRFGEEKIVLSGGCFQNAFLLERSIKRLRENNFKVYWHQRIPPNDGGLSLGQIAAMNYVRTY